MYTISRSGQDLYFTMVSAISGFAVGGISGSISGRKTIAGVQSLISGPIVDVSGGMYRMRGYDFDWSGSQIGFLFTASGCIPVSFNVVTVDNASGRFFPPSGSVQFGSGQYWLGSGSIVSTTIASGVFSGQLVNANVTPASLSGVFATVPPATLSGISPVSGAVVSVPVSSLSGIQPISGAYSIAGKVLDKSGYLLSASGLDSVQVESGMNFRQSQSAIAAAVAGRLSGAGTSTILIDGANASGTTRITATVNASGDRTSVILSLPS